MILNPDAKGVGEIVTRGRQVCTFPPSFPPFLLVYYSLQICLGYLWDEEKTRELIDADGWVHSGNSRSENSPNCPHAGDLGRVDEEGFFYVSGRIKELVITGGGQSKCLADPGEARGCSTNTSVIQSFSDDL